MFRSIIFGICLSLCSSAMAENEIQPTIAVGLEGFGIANGDTILKFNCNEFIADQNTSLFYADFRKELNLDMRLKCNTSITEQAFLCKEGRRGELYGDLTVGFDPGPEKLFAEVKDKSGALHRIFAGDEIKMGEWYDVNLRISYDVDTDSSTMIMTVTPCGALTLSSEITYPGYALPYNVGRWVIGRGYPGGFPNSLQVRNGELQSLTVAGCGLNHKAGENPIFTDRFTADPACLVTGGRIYAFVGEDCAAPGGWFTMPHWVAYSSDDMKHWTCHGVVLKAGDFPNANPNGAWAAQVVEKNGKFYFYVTLDDSRDGRHTINVAVGDAPLGPFTPVSEPMITDDMTPDSHRLNADIDPTVLVDDDGTAFIAWGNGDCYMARLTPDMTAIDGDLWHVGLRNYSEGPWLFKRNNLYYLVYAADAPGVQPEQIAYSTSTSIKGPWTYRGLLTGSARHGFTIHPSVNEFKGKWYFFYHDGCYHLNGTPGGDCRRHVCVEELQFNPDGTISPITLTHEGLSNSK